jgi:hypothetical protein
MKIFKQSADSDLFVLQDIEEDQLVALNDICKNYKESLLQITKLPNALLSKVAPGDPAKVRGSIQLQIKTCMAYEIAFADVLNVKDSKNKN